MSINDQIGQNIASVRQRRGITQRQLADMVSDESGRDITPSKVSAWERGAALIPAEMTIYISHALQCTSYELYPHSQLIAPQDALLYAKLLSMSPRDREIAHYLMIDWHGDTHALLELDLIHAVLPEYRRQYADMTIMEAYRECVSEHDTNMDTRIKTDIQCVTRAFRKLEKE